MLAFSLVPAGLGAIPGAAPVKAGTPGVTPQATTGAISSPDGTLTADGRLMWARGAFRVPSPDDISAAQGIPRLTETAAAYMTPDFLQYHPIYVGPFQFDPNANGDATNGGGIIKSYYSPTDLDPQWFPWIVAAAKRMTTVYKGVSGSGIPHADSGLFTLDPAIEDQLIGSIVGNYKKYSDHVPTALARILDSRGYPAHQINYADPQGNFQFHSYLDWWNSLGLPNPAGANWKDRSAQPIRLDMMLGSVHMLFDQFQHIDRDNWNPKDFAAGMPLAKFTHPASGKLWGMWLKLVPNSCRDATAWTKGCRDCNDNVIDASADTGGSALRVGAPCPLSMWYSGTDTPGSIVLEVGFAEIPTDGPWYDDIFSGIIDVIMFVPGVIWDIGEAVGDAVIWGLQQLKDLVCSNPQLAQKMAASDPDLETKLAAQGGIAILSQLCDKPTAPNCADPKNVALPSCLKMASTSTVPWGWIIGGLAAVALIFALTSKPKPAT